MLFPLVGIADGAHLTGIGLRFRAVSHGRVVSTPTTMSAARSMRRLVVALRGLFPRPLTIYAGNVESVRAVAARNTIVFGFGYQISFNSH